jgi:hypothetical protein
MEGVTTEQSQQQRGFDDCAKQALSQYRRTYLKTSTEAVLGGALIGLGASLFIRGIPGTGGAIGLEGAGHSISRAPAGQNAMMTAIIAADEAEVGAMVSGSVLGPGGYLVAHGVIEEGQNSNRLDAAIDNCRHQFPAAPFPFLNTKAVLGLYHNRLSP